MSDIETWYESRPSDKWGLDWYSCSRYRGLVRSRYHSGGINSACQYAKEMAARTGGRFIGYKKGRNW